MHQIINLSGSCSENAGGVERQNSQTKAAELQQLQGETDVKVWRIFTPITVSPPATFGDITETGRFIDNYIYFTSYFKNNIWSITSPQTEAGCWFHCIFIEINEIWSWFSVFSNVMIGHQGAIIVKIITSWCLLFCCCCFYVNFGDYTCDRVFTDVSIYDALN